jgi:hypothetical protein
MVMRPYREALAEARPIAIDRLDCSGGVNRNLQERPAAESGGGRMVNACVLAQYRMMDGEAHCQVTDF